MIVNYKCQLKPQDAWISDWTFSVGVPVLFSGEISIWIGRLCKADYPPCAGGHQTISWGLEYNKKVEEIWILHILPDCWVGTLTLSSPVSRVLRQGVESTTLVSSNGGFKLYPWLSRLSRWYTADPGTSQIPQSKEPILCNNYNKYISILFFWRTLIL